MSCTELAHRLADAGMDVMSGISRKTGLLVVNAGAPHSRKPWSGGRVRHPDRRRGHGAAAGRRSCLRAYQISAPAEIEVIDVISTPARPRNRLGRGRAGGPFVPGGASRSHRDASRIGQLGGVPAINPTSRVTQVLVLSGGEGESADDQIINRKLLLAMADVDAALPAWRP